MSAVYPEHHGYYTVEIPFLSCFVEESMSSPIQMSWKLILGRSR